MKRYLKKYTASWLVAVLAYNALAFVLANTVGAGLTTNFWITYAAVMVGFVGHFVCTRMVINQDNIERVFLNLPVISITIIGLSLLLIIGVIFLVVSNIPYWVAVVLCVLVVAGSTIAVINATTAAELVEQVHTASQNAQQTIRTLTAKVKVMADAQTEANLKREYTKLYEALRYSDPVSNSSLVQIEDEIEELVEELKDIEKTEISVHVAKILELINERNQLCKVMKVKS